MNDVRFTEELTDKIHTKFKVEKRRMSCSGLDKSLNNFAIQKKRKCSWITQGNWVDPFSLKRSACHWLDCLTIIETFLPLQSHSISWQSINHLLVAQTWLNHSNQSETLDSIYSFLPLSPKLFLLSLSHLLTGFFSIFTHFRFPFELFFILIMSDSGLLLSLFFLGFLELNQSINN